MFVYQLIVIKGSKNKNTRNFLFVQIVTNTLEMIYSQYIKINKKIKMYKIMNKNEWEFNIHSRNVPYQDGYCN